MKTLPKVFSIAMTQRDLQIGEFSNGSCCPLALAARRSLTNLGFRSRPAKPFLVNVTTEDGIEVTANGATAYYSLPVRANKFIEKFDKLEGDVYEALEALINSSMYGKKLPHFKKLACSKLKVLPEFKARVY